MIEKAGLQVTDVCDIYKNNVNMGARQLRECIFAILLKYLVQAAVAECRNTLEIRNAEVSLPKRIAGALRSTCRPAAPCFSSTSPLASTS